MPVEAPASPLEPDVKVTIRPSTSDGSSMGRLLHPLPDISETPSEGRACFGEVEVTVVET